MKKQEAVIEGIAKCLKSGGRFVAELGCSGNVQSKDFYIIAYIYSFKKLIFNPFYLLF
jgi:hypothetical protein